MLRTRAQSVGVEVVAVDLDGPLPDGEFSGLVASYPGCSGEVRDLAPVIAEAHQRGALVTVAADLLSLTLLVSPGELGADIAVGSTQRFGVPLFLPRTHAQPIVDAPTVLPVAVSFLREQAGSALIIE